MADSIFEPEISRSLKRLDFIIVTTPIAIECKKTTGTSLSFSAVNDDQVTALVHFEEQHFTQKMLVAASVGGKSRFKAKSGFDFLCCPSGRSFVLVNFRATKKAAGKDIPKGTNRCFALPIKFFVESKLQFLREGRKSFPYAWFDQNATELDRIRWQTEKGNEYGWDIIPLLN